VERALTRPIDAMPVIPPIVEAEYFIERELKNTDSIRDHLYICKHGRVSFCYDTCVVLSKSECSQLEDRYRAMGWQAEIVQGRSFTITTAKDDNKFTGIRLIYPETLAEKIKGLFSVEGRELKKIRE